jgi:oligopeptide transport system ATP-binding protein
MSLLEVRNLTTSFKTDQGIVTAVRGVDYRVEKGEILGIVGESGSGKSVGMFSLMGLLADNGSVTDGTITFDGEDITPPRGTDRKGRSAYEKKMRAIRGNKIGMIFQDPMSYLNPILTIERQLTEGIRCHLKYDKKKAREYAIELMGMVGIPNPKTRLRQYPFEFSGGMRQRIIIAAALACNPKLIIADEPTTALDVTVQAQILELIQKLIKNTEAGVIIITHDLGVVASLCDRISIMYGGRIMEEGTADEIFYDPKHPYTKGLLGSIARETGDEKEPLKPIPGTPPDLLKMKDGCPFAPRCEEAMVVCVDHNPGNTEFSGTHRCSCWLHCMEKVSTVAAPGDGADDAAGGVGAPPPKGGGTGGRTDDKHERLVETGGGKAARPHQAGDAQAGVGDDAGPGPEKGGPAVGRSEQPVEAAAEKEPRHNKGHHAAFAGLSKIFGKGVAAHV